MELDKTLKNECSTEDETPELPPSSFPVSSLVLWSVDQE